MKTSNSVPDVLDGAGQHRMGRLLNSSAVQELARQCGFQLAGVALPEKPPDFDRYRNWVDRGLAGEMQYLVDYRADVRNEPAKVLPGVRSIVCVGLVYNGPAPYSTEHEATDLAWISRYAWGDDYHRVVKDKLEQLAALMRGFAEFEWRACVDTAPLLERSFANRAGLGWIGKNTCLINQDLGSWFFLGELLTTLEIEPDSMLMPDRCGTCTRCIDTCPTAAIVPSPDGRFEIDARLCISYFTIELRSAIPKEHRAAMGHNVFGCDICQDVCPWNSPKRAEVTTLDEFAPRQFAPPLEKLASLSREEFWHMFRDSPVSRAKYSGFLRNVAIAMGNEGTQTFAAPLRRLAGSDDKLVAEAATWALSQIADRNA